MREDPFAPLVPPQRVFNLLLLVRIFDEQGDARIVRARLAGALNVERSEGASAADGGSDAK